MDETECEHKDMKNYEYDGMKIKVCEECSHSEYPKDKIKFRLVKRKVIDCSPIFDSPEKLEDWRERHASLDPNFCKGDWAIIIERGSD